MTRREKTAFWSKHIRRFNARGMNQRAYCRQHSLSPRQLGYWLRKSDGPPRTEAVVGGPGSDAPVWLPVQIVEEEPPENLPGIRVRVGRAAIEVEPGFNVSLFQEVVRALEVGC